MADFKDLSELNKGYKKWKLLERRSEKYNSKREELSKSSFFFFLLHFSFVLLFTMLIIFRIIIMLDGVTLFDSFLLFSHFIGLNFMSKTLKFTAQDFSRIEKKIDDIDSKELFLRKAIEKSLKMKNETYFLEVKKMKDENKLHKFDKELVFTIMDRKKEEIVFDERYSEIDELYEKEVEINQNVAIENM